jgi:hypothetical protein
MPDIEAALADLRASFEKAGSISKTDVQATIDQIAVLEEREGAAEEAAVSAAEVTQNLADLVANLEDSLQTTKDELKDHAAAEQSARGQISASVTSVSTVLNDYMTTESVARAKVASDAAAALGGHTPRSAHDALGINAAALEGAKRADLVHKSTITSGDLSALNSAITKVSGFTSPDIKSALQEISAVLAKMRV